MKDQPFWLSFVDESDGHFLGVSIVMAPDWDMAVRTAWKLDCNPGGQVQICPWPRGKPHPPAKWMNRVLTKEEVGNLEKELATMS